MPPFQIFYGPVINPVSLRTYDILPKAVFAVNEYGSIEWLFKEVEPHNLQEILASKGYVDVDVVELKDGQFFLPGFVDTHTHAPQVPNMGIGGQFQLLEWLKRVTFPTESKFADVDFARKTYESVVKRLINGGTTTACYYGTLHLEATKVLADIVHSQGQRAFVGKCNMNRESADNYVEPSADVSVANTKQLISYIRSFPQPVTDSSNQEPLVQPILTPRFAIACTDDLLTSLGALSSSDPTLRIQTHISENPQEIAFTKQLFPDCPTYASVYDKFHLLRHNTVLAHAVHLEFDEVKMVKERECGISHCPTSNFNISSGVAPIGAYLDRGIKVGLGTDVSGGFSYSILSTIRDASIAAKVHALSFPAPPDTATFAGKPLPIATLLYLATMGGAAVCDLKKQIGSLDPGKSFDALLIDVRNETGNPGLWGVSPGDLVGSSTEERRDILDGWLERFLFCGDDRNIAKVFVQGRLIGGSTFGR